MPWVDPERIPLYCPVDENLLCVYWSGYQDEGVPLKTDCRFHGVCRYTGNVPHEETQQRVIFMIYMPIEDALRSVNLRTEGLRDLTREINASNRR